jgi:predicted transcriptional regulator
MTAAAWRRLAGTRKRLTKIFVDNYERVRNTGAMPRLRIRPTDAELAILQVLWDRGPSTVRHVHDALAHGRETGYTTTLKLMQIMAEKGLVTRDESARSHVYDARRTRVETQRQLAADLMERAFGGSAAALALQALSARPASEEELRQLQQVIDDYRKR